MGKRIVIALGGNALGKNLHKQMDAVHVTAKAIADLIEDGHEVVIAHGNGPQVGMIQNAFAAYHKQEAMIYRTSSAKSSTAEASAFTARRSSRRSPSTPPTPPSSIRPSPLVRL